MSIHDSLVHARYSAKLCEPSKEHASKVDDYGCISSERRHTYGAQFTAPAIRPAFKATKAWLSSTSCSTQSATPAGSGWPPLDFAPRLTTRRFGVSWHKPEDSKENRRQPVWRGHKKRGDVRC